jgi:RNA polymerase sigma-70 factor (ECF subfamily)
MNFPRLVRPADPSQDALEERGDDELMELASAGLRTAFAVLVERHADRMVRACSRLVGDRERGEELAQDTWVLAWQAREKYRTEGSFVPWLITIARNHCRNELRRKKTLATHERAPLSEELDAEQLDHVLVEERRRRVQRALAGLPVALREALLLRFAEGLRYDEMTSVLGRGEATLRSRVHHGLKALKAKLKEDS